MDCTCSALRMAARRLTQIYDAALSPQGINTSQFALLGALSRRGDAPPTVRELASDLGMDRTTLGHNLRPMIRDGLVVVARDPEDRRIRRITLTDAGRAKRAAGWPLWRAAQDRFDAGFGPERSRDLVGTLLDVARHRDRPIGETAKEVHHAG